MVIDPTDERGIRLHTSRYRISYDALEIEVVWGCSIGLPWLCHHCHHGYIPSIESEAVNNHTFLPYLGNKQSFFEVWYLGLLTLRKSFSLLVGFLRHTMFALSRTSSPVAQFYQEKIEFRLRRDQVKIVLQFTTHNTSIVNP